MSKLEYRQFSRASGLLTAITIALMLPLLHADEKYPAIDVNKLIKEAVKSGQKSLKLPQGTYSSKTIILNRLNDFSLDGNGIKLIFTGNTRAITITNSKNIILKNLTIDYDPLPYTQGKVLSVSGESHEVLIQLHRGYPDLFRRKHLNLQVYDSKSRNLKYNGGDLFDGHVVSKKGKDTYLMKFGRQPADILAAGDLVALDWRMSTCIYLESVDGAILENLNILASPFSGIMGRFVSGKHILRHIVIRRGKTLPEGADEPRLVSTAGDAINYGYCELGPTIEDCDISFQGDDAVNIHGASLAILKQEAPDTLVLFCYHDKSKLADILRPGMKVRIMQDSNYAVYAENKLKSLAYLKDQNVDYKTLNSRFPRALRPDSPQAVFRMKLEKPVVLRKGLSSVDIPAGNGGGFIIRNNYFHDHRGMSIRMMAGDGVIENNRFERVMKSAIALGPEYQPWREAGWVENIIIRNNKMKDICTELRAARYHSGGTGAIMIRAGIPRGADNRYPGNRNITIENNVIDKCRVAGIYVDNTDKAVIINNTIINVMTDPNWPNAGSDFGWKITGPITVSPLCKNIKQENNKF